MGLKLQNIKIQCMLIYMNQIIFIPISQIICFNNVWILCQFSKMFWVEAQICSFFDFHCIVNYMQKEMDCRIKKRSNSGISFRLSSIHLLRYWMLPEPFLPFTKRTPLGKAENENSFLFSNRAIWT